MSINTAFVGNLGNNELLAGVGLGNLYVNIFCQSIILGLNGAVATLASQAYGSGNLEKVGLYLNRGRLVAFIAFIPITVVLLLCEEFMVLIGMDAQAA
jgi:MATE family multidrug resistance protein